MKKINLKEKQGVVLVELLIALAIVLIAVTATISLFTMFQTSFQLGSAYLDIHSDLRIAMDWITKDARWAKRFMTFYTTYNDSATCKILEIPSIDANKNVIDDRYDYVVYRLNGTNVERRLFRDAQSSRLPETRTIVRNCSNLAFATSGAILTTTITARRASMISISGAARVTPQETLVSRVKLRNM